MVYTGDRKDIAETLLLSDLYGGAGDAEVHVKALRGTGNGDIVDQYVRFCKIADEERKRHGRTGKAIEKTLRRCNRGKCVSAIFEDAPKGGCGDYGDII